MFHLMSKKLAVPLCVLGVLPIDDAALADVPLRCDKDKSVCACSVFDAREVHIYIKNEFPHFTHYNFKTNPGAQIELTKGHYSFQPKRGDSGTYSVQACARGGLGSRSVCTSWTTFSWNTERADRNCLSPGR